MDKTGVYAQKAGQYAAGRAGYAAKAIERIASLVPAGLCVADIGSGTGILSQELVQRGYRVYGVEPSKAMRQKAEARLVGEDGFVSIAGTAEQTGLLQNSVDCIVAASAFHWFNLRGFHLECRRILRDGGKVALLINRRDAGDALSKEQAQICREHCPSFKSFSHGAEYADENCAAFFSNYKYEEYEYDLVYTGEQFLARSLSSSYSPSPQEPGYAAYEKALGDLIKRHERDGMIVVQNRTALWHGEI